MSNCVRNSTPVLFAAITAVAFICAAPWITSSTGAPLVRTMTEEEMRSAAGGYSNPNGACVNTLIPCGVAAAAGPGCNGQAMTPGQIIIGSACNNPGNHCSTEDTPGPNEIVCTGNPGPGCADRWVPPCVTRVKAFCTTVAWAGQNNCECKGGAPVNKGQRITCP